MSEFAQRLLDWQAVHGRHDLPWQAGRDPYRVWLAEIMLQQTQVATVLPYYRRFVECFPDVQALAAASIDEVLVLWAGLGYYARARNLHRAAGMVCAAGGEFPRSARGLAELPGIGRSTAASIAAYCFGERAAILDGNVKRVLCRHFGIEGFPGERAVENQLWALAESLLPDEDIGRYPQAQMDLGALVCTRGRPRCGECPVQASCVAQRESRQKELPAPRPRKAVPERSRGVLLIRVQGEVLLERRPPQGIWGGLYSLPELLEEESPEQGLLRVLGETGAGTEPELAAPLRHVFTHFALTLLPWVVELEHKPVAAEEGARRWVAEAELDAFGLPAPVRRLLD